MCHVKALTLIHNCACSPDLSLSYFQCDHHHAPFKSEKQNKFQQKKKNSHLLVSLFLCLCQEQGAWRGEQTPHTSDTLTLMTLSENTHKSLAPPTETEDMLTSPNVMTSGEGVGGALEKLVGVLEMYSTPSQQTHLDETPYVLQSLGSTSTSEHRTHTPSDVVDHSLDSRSTHDTHTPITVKPHLEKTEPLAASTSLVSTDADSDSHPTDSNFTQTLCSSTHFILLISSSVCCILSAHFSNSPQGEIKYLFFSQLKFLIQCNSCSLKCQGLDSVTGIYLCN